MGCVFSRLLFNVSPLSLPLSLPPFLPPSFPPSLPPSLLPSLPSCLLPSSDKLVKEVKERLLRAKGTPNLEKVTDINVLCGVVKDFFRGLREPILTFRMHKAFMDAAGQAPSQQLRTRELIVCSPYRCGR